MRSYEFVADRLILESLLTEEFKMGELPDSYGGGWGVVDAEGKVVANFDNEAEAKKFMDQENAKLKKVGGETGKPEKKLSLKKIIGRVTKVLGKISFVKILTFYSAFEALKDIVEVFEGHARWLKGNYCVQGESFRVANLSLEQTENFQKVSKQYSALLAKQLTELVLQTLNAFVAGLIAVSRISGILSRFPGTPAWVITTLVWAGTTGAVIVINKLIEHPKTYPWINKFFFTHSRKIFLNDMYNTEVCNDTIDFEAVPDWVPLVNEAVDPDADDEESILLLRWKQIWSDIYKDPEVQAAYKQAKENKKKNIKS